jgi:hypothetical protein
MGLKKIVLGILIAIFVVLAFYLAYAAGSKSWPFKMKYQVVVLESGEVYFGNFSSFPQPKISNAWMPQQTKDEKNQVGLQLVPVSSSYFTPKNTIYLNKDKILWWADLEDTSQVVKIMKGEAESRTTEESVPTSQNSPSPTQTK